MPTGPCNVNGSAVGSSSRVVKYSIWTTDVHIIIRDCPHFSSLVSVEKILLYIKSH